MTVENLPGSAQSVHIYEVVVTAEDGPHSYTIASWGDDAAARRIAWRRYVQDAPDGRPLSVRMTSARPCPRRADGGGYDLPRDAILDRREW
jgi:hypothetical protein